MNQSFLGVETDFLKRNPFLKRAKIFWIPLANKKVDNPRFKVQNFHPSMMVFLQENFASTIVLPNEKCSIVCVQNIFIFEAQMCFLTWCQGCWFIGVGPFKTITVTLAVETVIRFKQNRVRCNICLLQEQSSHCNSVFTRPMCILHLKKILCKPASLVSVLALLASSTHNYTVQCPGNYKKYK